VNLVNPRPSSSSRPLRLAVALALVGASVSGCTFEAVPAATPSATVEPASYEAVYEESPCPSPNVEGTHALDLGPEYTCGYLTVPQTRSDPDGPTVRIAVATVPAVAATPGSAPIVYLDGGPGGTGLVSAAAATAAGLNAEHDVVFVDQRGTYHSEPFLSCPEQDAFYLEAVTLVSDDPATGEKSDAATAACRERLVADGVLLDSFNTAENAADIADLRVAMGIDEWNVYGVSYGTDLALTLLREHPAGIRSVVLDSVVPPNVRWTADFWPTSAAAFDEMYAACAAQPACAAAYPDLEAVFTDTVNRLDAQPLTVPVTTAAGDTVPVVVDGYKLANAAVLRLATGPSYSAVLPQMIHEIARGDGTGIAESVIQYLPPAGLVGLGLQWSVFCSEDLPRTSLEETVAIASDVLPAFPESVLSLMPQVPRFFADCEIWDVPPADEDTHEAVVSDVPVLLLGGTFDAVTSPSWQEPVTPTLSASQVVNFPGLGHQVIVQDPCPVAVINTFLADPASPVEEDCVAQVTPPVFTVP
jgi:pimeloyl-ACP methyl ester carboxylesterase